MGRRGTSISSNRDKKVPRTTELAVKDHLDDSGDFMQLESRESALREILLMLQSDRIPAVALYGMSGVGKTALAKQVAKRSKEMRIFNLVVFVHVTTTPNVNKIQRDIAAALGLGLEKEDDDDLAARQRQISLRLRNEGRVLIILDDVRQRLNMQEIGISACHDGCKVLLTCHSLEVGYVMGFQHSYHLFLLSEEEAWQLFRKNAGIDDGSLEFICLARKVASYCEGLPLAISVIGYALRGKSVGQWRDVIETLDTLQRLNVSVFIPLLMQLSYDAICSNSQLAMTLLFLYGFFSSHHHENLIEDLSQHATRLGLCSNNEVTAAINSLSYSCLQKDSNESRDLVVMGDYIRNLNVRKLCTKHDPRDCIPTNKDELSQCLEELKRLLRQLYGPSTSNSTSFYDGGECLKLQVARPYSYRKAATNPKPSGKLVDFCGLCKVDKSFLPLLKEACAMNPQLIESQRRHSEMLRQSAFECLGRVLFLLNNVRKRDLLYHKDELEKFWEQLKLMKFDLDWLSPAVEGVFSSAEITRIEALRKEENYWNQEAAKLREQLKIVENKAAAFRTEIALTESQLDGLTIARVSDVPHVSKVTPRWKKFFFKK